MPENANQHLSKPSYSPRNVDMAVHRGIPSTHECISYFPRFNELPLELRRFTWFLALPGPRIVHVQRRPTSGHDIGKYWSPENDEVLPIPNYFISPSSSEQIVALLQTCRESRSVTQDNYTLLFPTSSTWFSFTEDFLYLDFGRQSLHMLSYLPRDFTVSIPEPDYVPHNSSRYRYPRPIFNEELAKKIKNLVLSLSFYSGSWLWSSVLNELVTIFTGVEVLILADHLYNGCCEGNEEFVWLRGQLGDEIGSTAQLEVDAHGTERWRELETEKRHRHLLIDLLHWRGRFQHGGLEDKEVDDFLQAWERSTRSKMPTVIRKSITTRRTKNRLLAICGSDDDFLALVGLDWGFVEGRHEYSGSLDLSQQLDYLELVIERVTATCELGCADEEGGDRFRDDVPFLLYRIDMLVLKIMRSLEATTIPTLV